LDCATRRSRRCGISAAPSSWASTADEFYRLASTASASAPAWRPVRPAAWRARVRGSAPVRRAARGARRAGGGGSWTCAHIVSVSLARSRGLRR
jgi:hypothetical protein